MRSERINLVVILVEGLGTWRRKSGLVVDGVTEPEFAEVRMCVIGDN